MRCADRITSARSSRDTEHAGRHNLVVGGDLSIRPVVAAAAVGDVSVVRRPAIAATATTPTATPAQVSYSYETRRFQSGSQVEHYDRDFQMDTAFYNRTGFTAGLVVRRSEFLSGSGKNFWLQRVNPFLFAKVGHDDVQDGDEDFCNTGIRFNFTRQGYFEHRAVTRSRSRGAASSSRPADDINMFAGDADLALAERLSAACGAGPAIYLRRRRSVPGRSRSSASSA